ncbi:MAG: hypothetical protein KO206_01340 [Methanomicrobiaceae archaeon]|nr:hypothetical protein [Methanomicrobiaceae archaeon]
MNRQKVLTIAGIAGAVCIGASGAAAAGYLPLWLAEILLVIAFPLFVLFIGLWWNAAEGDEDIPFIGY